MQKLQNYKITIDRCIGILIIILFYFTIGL
jgi:hypothetical protein